MIRIKNKDEALEIILQQKPLVIYQGHSEWGPRALGNRSILFDPRNPNAKDIVNSFKKREWWRPLAGTVLLEYANEYFDLATLKESPHMSFAIDARQKAIDEVPSIVHVDNTCRIQTLKRKDNPNYYDLINCFYSQTKVPMLLNTSFNLAGFPIVENDLFLNFTVSNSEFKYVYTP
jgi:carbamoyltransferase|tara:strand:- start:4 stop:531 length:528 start_codon:yes stop_codon:yes gene_type:complete